MVTKPKQTRKRKPQRSIRNGVESTREAGVNRMTRSTGKGPVTSFGSASDPNFGRDTRNIDLGEGRSKTINPQIDTGEIPRFQPIPEGKEGPQELQRLEAEEGQRISGSQTQQSGGGIFSDIQEFAIGVLGDKEKTEVAGTSLGTIAASTALGLGAGGPVGGLIGFGTGVGIVGGFIGASTMGTWLTSDNIATQLSLQANITDRFLAAGGNISEGQTQLEAIETNLNFAEGFVADQVEKNPLLWGQKGKAYTLNLEIQRRTLENIKKKYGLQ